MLGRISNPYRNWHNRLHLEPSRAYSGPRALSGHLISYDLARGLHIIAVIAWIAGMLMLPRFYAAITAAPHGEAGEEELLRQARHIRTLIVTPSMIMAWAFGIFLFFTYFASDWDDPVARLVAVPHWFWAKLGLVLGLSRHADRRGPAPCRRGAPPLGAVLARVERRAFPHRDCNRVARDVGALKQRAAFERALT